MRLPVLLLLVSCAGCPPHPIPTPLPDMTPRSADMATAPNEYGLASCPMSMTVSYSDVCDGMFTTSGLACAHCTGAASCYDVIDAVYCASGPAGCLGDNACNHLQDGSEGAPSEGPRKAKTPLKKTKKAQ